MSVTTEYMKPVHDLYREVASGELQARVASIGPVSFHPDYLSLNERRYDLDIVGTWKDTLSPLMRQFAENDGEALPLEEVVPPLEPGYVNMPDEIGTINTLIQVKLLKAEKTQDGTWMLLPRDEAYDLNHDQPFYRPSTSAVAAATLVSGLATGAFATGGASMGVAEMAVFYESFQAGAFGGFMFSGLASAVKARHFYKKHGF